MAMEYTQTERTRNLPVYPIYSCPICGYPIGSSVSAGEEVHCPYCSGTLIAQEVSIPSWLLAGAVGLGIGVIFGPSILAATESGSQWLAKKSRERIK
jgi:DNA-directed RNA polymerase subunit RPC12/RpoP